MLPTIARDPHRTLLGHNKLGMWQQTLFQNRGLPLLRRDRGGGKPGSSVGYHLGNAKEGVEGPIWLQSAYEGPAGTGLGQTFFPVRHSGAMATGCPRREQEAGVRRALTLSPRLGHVVVVLRAWS